MNMFFSRVTLTFEVIENVQKELEQFGLMMYVCP